MTAGPRALLFLLLLVPLAACGGSGPDAGTPVYGEFPVPGGVDDPGTAPGGGSPPLPPELTGGVLATLDASGETFSMWVPDSPTAQTLADAWAGAGPAIQTVCADVEPGAGLAGHNAPWSWSVRTTLPILLNGPCLGCAFAWDTPSKAEAGIQAGPPYDCPTGPEDGARAMIRMQVALIGLQDAR